MLELEPTSIHSSS